MNQLSIWGKSGFKLHFIPTQKNVREVTLYHKMIERGHVIHEAYNWNAILEGTPVLSFCNAQETDDIAVNGTKHTVTETFDAFGRSVGYVLGKGSTALDTVAYGYGAEGRLETASFLHGGEKKTFTYSYLEGTKLLHTIAHPNNILITRNYEQNRDLITSMNATRGATNVVLRGYTYDELGRPITRTCSRQGTTRQDSFAYNDRSELASATLGITPYAYAHDNIGNRETAQEAAQDVTSYATNPLNQYSSITQGTETPFTPVYDTAGNQTKVKTSTGIWTLVYDANNRPTSFTSEDGQTLIVCGYDYMGRRFMKKVTVGEVITLHQFYLYRGYLQIAALDLTRSTLNALWFVHWDPTEPVATRPLSIRKNATWYTYGHDLTKNVMELYKTDGTIATAYNYTPYGAVTATGIDQPFQWSSEVYDAELGMVYYNYRHYNPSNGRWIGRYPIGERSSFNLYRFIYNFPVMNEDILGLYAVLCFSYAEGKTIGFDQSDPNNTIDINNVFSGNGRDANNPDSQHKSDQGPLPEGEYWIGGQYTPSSHTADAARGGNYDWHKLYGDDGKGGKSYDSIPVKDPNTGQTINRGGFNLHTGRASNGCITVYSDIDDSSPTYPQSKNYDNLSDFLGDSGKKPFENPRKQGDTYLGIMLVKKCLKDCEKALNSYKK